LRGVLTRSRQAAPLALISLAIAAASAGCGSQGIDVPEGEQEMHQGAVTFSERCSGCHTLKAAGTEGTANRSQRVQGPNLDQRTETYEDVIFAIRNGGFSGAIMPQNIVVGDDARKVAAFVAEYAGQDVEESPRPGQ
jgi:mono/diheme cytochrome c family protein